MSVYSNSTSLPKAGSSDGSNNTSSVERRGRIIGNPIIDLFRANYFLGEYSVDLKIVAERFRNADFLFLNPGSKVITLINNWFTPKERDDFWSFTSSSNFSRFIYSTKKSKTMGEQPARKLPIGMETQLLSSPPAAIESVFSFLRSLELILKMQVHLQPNNGDIRHVATNLVTPPYLSSSSRLGLHKDCDPEKGVPFDIPVLYEDGEVHQKKFKNGDPGKPWLVTLMLYAAGNEFDPKNGLGTLFIPPKNGLGTPLSNRDAMIRIPAIPMQMVLFESDIPHTIQPSGQLADSSRVSYVFKLVFNPTKADQSVKTGFQELMK